MPSGSRNHAILVPSGAAQPPLVLYKSRKSFFEDYTPGPPGHKPIDGRVDIFHLPSQRGVLGGRNRPNQRRAQYRGACLKYQGCLLTEQAQAKRIKAFACSASVAPTKQARGAPVERSSSRPSAGTLEMIGVSTATPATWSPSSCGRLLAASRRPKMSSNESRLILHVTVV